MGQTQTTQQIQQTYQIVYHKDQSNVLLKHKKNGNQLLLRTFSSFLQDQINGFQKLIEKRRKIKNTHLLDILDVKKKQQKRVCSILQKLYFLIEYPFKTLQDQIQQRKNSQPKAYFNQSQLWSILYSCAVAIHTLYSNNFTHQALNLSQIYVQKTGLIKISDPLILGLQKNYIQILKKNGQNNVPLSPEIMSFLQDCNFFYYEKQKSDVYVLGLLMLQAATIKIIQIYDPIRKKPHLQLIDQYLQQISVRYSGLFVQTLQQMLNKQPKYRPMMIDIISKIQEQNSVRMQSYQSSNAKWEHSVDNSLSQSESNYNHNFPLKRTNSQNSKRIIAGNMNKSDLNHHRNYKNQQNKINSQNKIELSSKPVALFQNLKSKALGKPNSNYYRQDIKNVEVTTSNLQSENNSAEKNKNNQEQDFQKIQTNDQNKKMIAQNKYLNYDIQHQNNQKKSSSIIVSSQNSKGQINNTLKPKGITHSLGQKTKSSQFLHIGKSNSKTKLSIHKPVILSNKNNKFEINNQKKSNANIIKQTTSPVQELKPQTPQFTNQKDFSQIHQRYSYLNFGNITINYRPIESQSLNLNQYNAQKKQQIFQNPLKKTNGKNIKSNTSSVPTLNSLFYSSPYTYNENNVIKKTQEQKQKIIKQQTQKQNTQFHQNIPKVQNHSSQKFNIVKQKNVSKTPVYIKNSEKKILTATSPKDQNKYINKSQQNSSQKRSFIKSQNFNYQNIQFDKNDQEPSYVIQNYGSGGRYQGFKIKGKKNGQGRFYYKNGGFYDGNWVDNKMEGYGKLYFATGQLSYQGHWIGDEFSGNGRIFNDRVQKFCQSFNPDNFQLLGNKWVYYEGQFDNDSKHGKGKINLSNGQIFDGNFVYDMIQGAGTFYYLNGEILSGIWKQNKLINSNK